MTASPETDQPKKPQQEELAATLADLTQRGQALIADFLANQPAGQQPFDPLNVSGAFIELSNRMLADPKKLADSQMSLWQDYTRLWQNATLKMLGEEVEPLADAPQSDRRFKDQDWRDNAIFDFIKQGYFLTAKHIHDTVGNVEGLSPKDRAKVDFYTRQFVDAISPSNFVLTNPEVLRATIAEKGDNLLRGLKNVVEDLERGKGRLAIKMTDLDAFELGRNIAVTPGKVVFENRLFQLIQYAPATETVHATPLLILPPWINKFYILDLSPEKSFIAWAVAQGYTVFCVSWVNPDERYADTGFEDYMVEGALCAIDAVKKASGEASVNLIGYCIAGTLLAATLAYLSAKGEAEGINSATFLTTQVDFSEAGELSIFVDPEQVAAIDKMMEEKGYLDGSAMATTFNMLRANDLIWSFVVNHYLLGKEPFPFDLLYWNSDATRLPRAMHRYYLTHMYENNDLAQGRLVLDGVPIDLKSVKTPVYIQAGKEDHIAPFPSVYKLMRAFGGQKTMLLAGSGHIAGVINPPSANKYQYWTNQKLPATPEVWLEGATETPGSWWPHWQAWLARHSGGKVPARQPGEGALPAIEDAPGRYVMQRY